MLSLRMYVRSQRRSRIVNQALRTLLAQRKLHAAI